MNLNSTRFAITGLGVGWGCCQRGGQDRDISPCVPPGAQSGDTGLMTVVTVPTTAYSQVNVHNYRFRDFFSGISSVNL
jgi:hypothetical protein